MKTGPPNPRQQRAVPWLGRFFAFIFICSILFLWSLFLVMGPMDVLVPLVALFSALVSAVGTIWTVIHAWRVSKNDAIERDLRIAKLEWELEQAKKLTKPE
jgi:hypothetical protein